MCSNGGAHAQHCLLLADNDQGEEAILAVVVECPPEGRVVAVAPRDEIKSENCEKIRIRLGAGDAYLMDGKGKQCTFDCYEMSSHA